MSKENGGPAFPGEDPDKYYRGMSLRDYFAAEAMAGHFAAGQALIPAVTDSALKERAKLYYRMADAMLAERK